MRVLMDERTLAMIHGCVGPAFFAFTAALAVVTSRRWQENSIFTAGDASPGLMFMTVATPVLAYLQIILGAQVRHIAPDAAPQTFQILVFFHVAVGLALLVQIIAAAVAVWRSRITASINVRLALILCGLVAVQVALGGGTWIVKYGWPAFLFNSDNAVAFTVVAQSWWQAQITTAHVAVGSLIFALSIVQAVFVARRWWPQHQKSRSLCASDIEKSPESSGWHALRLGEGRGTDRQIVSTTPVADSEPATLRCEANCRTADQHPQPLLAEAAG